MGAATKIQWCQHTLNPLVGCSKAHTGCLRCYAETYANYTGIAKWGPAGTRLLSKGPWKEVAKWNAAAKERGEKELTFCASLADVFEDWRGPMTANRAGDVWHVSETGGPRITLPRTEYREGYRLLTMNDVRVDLFKVIDNSQNLIFQMLTKRPENIANMWPLDQCGDCYGAEQRGISCGTCGDVGGLHYPRKNVWLGTSISDQETADKFGPRLKEARDLAPVLFYSIEPLVGPVTSLDLDGIDWVIIGGESGAGARPCSLHWIRDIIAICRAAGVPVFVKQIGAKAEEWEADCRDGTNGPYISNTMRDDKGGDMSEWRPEWGVSVREWPASHAAYLAAAP